MNGVGWIRTNYCNQAGSRKNNSREKHSDQFKIGLLTRVGRHVNSVGFSEFVGVRSSVNSAVLRMASGCRGRQPAGSFP